MASFSLKHPLPLTSLMPHPSHSPHRRFWIWGFRFLQRHSIKDSSFRKPSSHDWQSYAPSSSRAWNTHDLQGLFLQTSIFHCLINILNSGNARPRALNLAWNIWSVFLCWWDKEWRFEKNRFENHSTNPLDGIELRKNIGSRNMFRKPLGLNNNRNN